MFKGIRPLLCRNMFDYSSCKYYVGVVEVKFIISTNKILKSYFDQDKFQDLF